MLTSCQTFMRTTNKIKKRNVTAQNGCTFKLQNIVFMPLSGLHSPRAAFTPPLFFSTKLYTPRKHDYTSRRNIFDNMTSWPTFVCDNHSFVSDTCDIMPDIHLPQLTKNEHSLYIRIHSGVISFFHQYIGSLTRWFNMWRRHQPACIKYMYQIHVSNF